MKGNKALQQILRKSKSSSTAAAAVSNNCPFHQEEEVSITQEVQDIFSDSKAYSEVPKPKGLPFVGTVLHYILNGGGRYLHEYVHNRHQQLGPIYREKYSTEPFEVLFVGDIQGAKDIYKNEGKTPLSFLIGGEELYLKLNSHIKRGLLFSQGDDWVKLRRPMNELLLKRNDYYDSFDQSSAVIHEQLSHWSKMDPLTNLPEKVNEIGVYSFGAFAFGERFEEHILEIEKDTNGFYKFTKDYWNSSMAMQIIPPWIAHKLKLPLWSRFESAISSMLAIGHKWTDIAKNDLKSRNNERNTGFLHVMLQEYDDPNQEIVKRIFSDFIAALESETTMIQWIIYAMGRNVKLQEKLYEEIGRNKSDGILTWRDTESMPYLSACIKESLRMYPANCFNVRILPADSLIKGYRVPAGTIAVVALLTSQRDPSIFPNPNTFWPERWLRNNDGKLVGVYGCQPYLPFGLGSARGCIFRKISIKRMGLFLGNFVKSYTFTTEEVQPVMRTLMIPNRDMRLKIQKRN